jgi:hypothetical protein
VNWQNIRQRMSSDAVATVAGMQARLQANDVPGALDLLEQRAVRQENAGDTAGAAQTRSFEKLINTNPEGAKQLASSILNAGSANSAGELYANQASQAGAAVAQNTVPAKIAAANAGASLAGTQAAYAPAQAEAGINATQAGTALTNANTGLVNQQITAPPAAIAAAQPEYTSVRRISSFPSSRASLRMHLARSRTAARAACSARRGIRPAASGRATRRSFSSCARRRKSRHAG